MSKSNEVTLDEALAIAQKHHQAGNLTLADRTYRDIINVLPEEFTSLHFLGVIAYQQGNPNEGAEFMARAVAVREDNPETWNIYAVLLDQIGKSEEALEKWAKALELRPDFPEALSNMGNCYWRLGRYEEGEKACRRATEIKPDYADPYINLGNALMSQDKNDEAIASWEKALELNPRHHKAFINIGNLLRDMGRINESEEYCRKALELVPNSPEALLNLANALRDQGNFEEAEKTYRQATSVKPNYVEAHNNHAIVLMDLLRFDEAITAARYAIAFNPKYANAYSNLAIALREVGQLKEAEETARKSLALNPDSAEARIDLADILFLHDNLDEAETLFNDAMEMVPDNPRLYLKLSNVLERANRIDEALEAINKAVELNPEMPEAYHRQAMICMMGNRIQQALDSLDKALELKPKYPAALATKSEILQTHGDMEGAKKAASEALSMSDKIPFVYFTLGKVKKFTEDDEDFIKMKQVAENALSFGKAQATSLHFALFKAYQDVGDYDKAFEHLKTGNDLKFSAVPFDRDAQQNSFNKTKEVYSKEFIDSFKGEGSDSDVPIFIVGMPRSGTTLTEQIISSHPEVFGAGELHYLAEVEKELGFINHDNCKALGDRYVELTRNIDKDSKTARKITDKMPGNYMRLGQILATLPNAKIIHCRRNPVDTCLSCYKQLFSRGHYWSYNLDAMAEHYSLYHDMMNYWRENFGDRFIDIDYEETVSDFENQARRLLNFVEMEWDDACLTPHKTKRSILTASKGQVRKPIYKSSVEAWRRYEKQLEPLAEALKPYM